ncbi:unnamed protein product [Dracunculus medinensis]|uniref:RAP domain-containing protein n=1 Tax=Dracunculus medinensis TaxID=318479 RepID=A0A0N4UC51_DRAME|nr:unnamed protein product [Dracunculus medinensis]
MKLSLCWHINFAQFNRTSNSHFRINFIETVYQMQNNASVHYIPLCKVLSKKYTNNYLNKIIRKIPEIINFHESINISIENGLYLCYMKLFSDVKSIHIIVPENLPSMLPFILIRDNSHITKDEWEWIRLLEKDDENNMKPTRNQLAFHKLLVNSINKLAKQYEINNIWDNRLYRLQIFYIKTNISFILVFHLCTYNMDFIKKYCEISLFIEYLLMVCLFFHYVHVYSRISF